MKMGEKTMKGLILMSLSLLFLSGCAPTILEEYNDPCNDEYLDFTSVWETDGMSCKMIPGGRICNVTKPIRLHSCVELIGTSIYDEIYVAQDGTDAFIVVGNHVKISSITISGINESHQAAIRVEKNCTDVKIIGVSSVDIQVMNRSHLTQIMRESQQIDVNQENERE